MKLQLPDGSYAEHDSDGYRAAQDAHSNGAVVRDKIDPSPPRTAPRGRLRVPGSLLPGADVLGERG